MILFGLFDLILFLSVKFVMWIVKQKIDNEQKLLKKLNKICRELL